MAKRGKNVLAMLEALLAGGVTFEEASRRLGVPVSTLHDLATSRRLARRRRAKPTNLRRRAKRLLFDVGLTQRETARRLGVAKSTINRWAREAESGPQTANSRSKRPRRLRTAVRCPNCGALVNVLPCLTCDARQARRR